jgi:hypothetical protein
MTTIQNVLDYTSKRIAELNKTDPKLARMFSIINNRANENKFSINNDARMVEYLTSQIDDGEDGTSRIAIAGRETLEATK